jgi:uncharacterized protein YbjT (DUF2867 family)
MTILITGAAGLNGTAAVHEFARHGEPIRALVRNRAPARELDDIPIVELVEGDMLLPETLGPALDGVDRVLLISSTNPRMTETQCTITGDGDRVPRRAELGSRRNAAVSPACQLELRDSRCRASRVRGSGRSAHKGR